MVFLVIIEHSVLIVLVFYYKDMLVDLEKVTMQRTQQFPDFSLAFSKMRLFHEKHLLE